MTASTDTVHGMLEATASRSPDADATVFPGDRYTYAELVAETTAAATRLRGLGLGPGDSVGLMVPASAAQVALLIGTMRIGAMPVPLNGRMKPHELEFLVHHSGMRVLLCDEAAATLAAQIPMGECRAVRVGPDGSLDQPVAPVAIEEVERLADGIQPDDPRSSSTRRGRRHIRRASCTLTPASRPRGATSRRGWR